jgi:hypothetical protein
MRRSLEQQRLLAICKKLDEVVDRLGDEDCVALVNAIGKVVKANERAPVAPDFDSMSLAELLDPTSVGVKKSTRRKKRSKRGEEGDKEEDDLVLATPPPSRSSGGKGSLIKKPKNVKKDEGEEKESYDSTKHAIIVEVKEVTNDAIVVSAKKSNHHKAGEHLAVVTPDRLKDVSKGGMDKLKEYVLENGGLPEAFKDTELGKSVVPKK